MEQEYGVQKNIMKGSVGDVSDEIKIRGSLDSVKKEYIDDGPEILKEYFDNNYSRYMETLKEFSISRPYDKIVLDVGILPGHMAFCLKKLGFSVKGISFGKRVEEICADTFNDFKSIGIEVERVNIEKEPLPYADDSFDYILFTDVIEHLSSNLMGAMKELRRVLKDDGKLVLSTPNVANIGNRIEILKGRNIYWELYQFYERDSEDRHNREFTLCEVADVLNRTGFKVAESRYMMHMPEAKLLKDYRTSVFKFIKSRIVYILAYLYPSFRSLFLVVAEKVHGGQHINAIPRGQKS